MKMRALGRTGLSVSQLGFGAMRLPMLSNGTTVDRELSTPMFHAAFDAGVNYVDTAVGYCHEDSQRAVGDALKGYRERIIVSTKNPDYGTDESAWRRNLENSLARLNVSCIDIYKHHGINWKRYTEIVEPVSSKWMQKAKDEGLIRHISVSFHDSPENLIKIINTGYPDVITLQYNILDRQLADGIALAHEKGIGIVVMGPVGGGRLGASSPVLEGMVPGIKRVPELALRFVLSNQDISVALSGMSTMEQVRENCAVAADAGVLSGDDTKLIDDRMIQLKKMAELYCTGCNYCMPCPSEVAIPKIFERYNRGKIYGLWDNARSVYATIGREKWDAGQKADSCIECGACEEKCPQHIPIREQLREAHKALAV
ncbi:MAG: aldo/keto reductase [Spirochaetota bacterium]